jgi:precorrin-2/cobalt-factor-2 C20-methyltransferase
MRGRHTNPSPDPREARLFRPTRGGETPPPRVGEGAGGWGSLTGVGLGPGDPELITLKAVRAVREADVVFAPARRDGDPSYALEIAGHLVDPARQEVVTLAFPTAAEGESWEGPCRTIVATLRGGRRGVFLTEGDPGLYSTFGHVMATLRQLEPRIGVDVVPGVSAVTAAAAAAGVSLADYGERLAIIPAPYWLDRLEDALRAFDCVVLLKVGSVLGETIDLLDHLDLLGRAIYVRRCGRPEQQVVLDLASLRADSPADYFALIVVRRSA